MAVYKYKAIGSGGQNVEGTFNANSKEDVIKMLRQNKQYPVSVVAADANKDISLDFLNKVKTRDLAVLCRQLYAMLSAGVTLINGLQILKSQTENKKLRQTLENIHSMVQKGMTFSETLRKHRDVFPDLLINMIEAGEASGKLDTILDRMATHYEKENKIQNKVKGAMVYPIILSVVCVGVVVFMLMFVMPTFVGMFEGSDQALPKPTQILIAMSNTLREFWYIFLVAVIGLVYGISYAARTEQGRLVFDQIKFKLPVVKGVTQKIITARFTRTLSTLLSSGIPLLQALTIVSRIVNNKVVEQGIVKAREDVRKGVDLATPIKNMQLFPPMVESMIKIGEESGALDDILDKTANFYDEEVEVAMQKLTTMIEPLMIIFMAAIIGSIVIAMVMPMFEMAGTI